MTDTTKDPLGLGEPPPLEMPAHANGEVDARPAIIDGRSGGLVQPPLVEATDDDDSILAALAHAVEAEAAARTAMNKAKNAHAGAKKVMDAAAQHAATYWARTRQVEMTLTVGGTEPDDDA